MIEPLTDDELRTLIRACAGSNIRDRRDEALVRFMVETGARAGETVGLLVADVDLQAGGGPSPAAELRSAYSFGIIALAARRTPRFRLRAPTRVMAVGRDGEAGRRTTISSPTPMVPGLLTVA